MNSVCRRFLALGLAIVLTVSNLTFGTAAEQSVYCGNEDHVHTDECYVSKEASAEPDASAAEPTVPTAETTPETENEPTEEATEVVCTCGTGDDTHSAECALYEASLCEQLLETQTLQALHDALMEDQEKTSTLTAAEITAVQDHADELYAAIEEPTEDEREYYEQIMETLAVLQGEEQSGTPVVLTEPTELTSAGGTLSTGEYILNSDIKLETKITIKNSANVTIDLNGYMLEGPGDSEVIFNNSGCTVTIKDSRPNDNVHYFRRVENGPWQLLDGYAEGEDVVQITGGIITGGREQTPATNSANGGGAIKQGSGSTATCIIQGGTLIGNSSTRAGGAVYGGRVTMSGGCIKGNYAYSFAGGVSVSGAFTMSGGTIEENQTSPDSERNNASKEATYYENADVIIGYNSRFNMSGGTIRGNVSSVSTSGRGPSFTITGGQIYGNFRLLTTITATFSGGELIGSVFMVNGTCIVQDDALIHNGKAVEGGGVCIRDGSFQMSGGKIENAEAEKTGGAIHIDKGSCTITGGEISNCTAAESGGGVYLSGGTLTMTGGKLLENRATQNGGGVYVSGGTATVSGGSVQYNTATDGAGIYVSNGSATVSGTGTVSHNTASQNGGGAYITGGDFTLDGETAELSANEAQNGAGVYLTGGQPNLLQGKLTGNIASVDGGGIYIDKQEVVLKPTGDVTVTSNKANRGAGIFIGGTDGSDAGFSVSEDSTGTVDISGNTALADGGAVCINNGYFRLETDNITLHGNEAVNGGAVAVLSGDFSMSDGTIGGENNGNTAKNGGAVYVSGGTVTITGGSLLNNTATQHGGGAYITGGDFVLNGASAAISGNKAENGAGIYLTGGHPVLQEGSMQNNEASGLGGGIYIDQQEVKLSPVGTVQIRNNRAVDGAGIYIGGTAENRASFAVSSDSSGLVEICDNTASGNGAGVCINNGQFRLDSEHIALQRNTANQGGAVAVLSGDFNMSGGTIGGENNGNTAENGGAVYVSNGQVSVNGGDVLYNQASQNGGGIYVDGGEVALSGGNVNNNTAQDSGGGIAVNNGSIVMSGGYVNSNEAVTGSGGGIYVTSSQGEVRVTVYSGYIQGNTAAVSGGAVGLKGGQSSNITVQIGVNLLHKFTNNTLEPIPHAPYTHTYCPVITDNSSSVSGGAFYITGGAQTILNMYCLEESGNTCPGDTDINGVRLSDFLMVEGGKVTISTAEGGGCDDTDEEENNDNHGNAEISGSVHVAGGTLDLFGNMENPKFTAYITVDLTKQEDYYHDHRSNNGYIKLSYHENFNFNGIVDSTHTAIDLKAGEEHTISDSLYKHEGYEIYGWNTDSSATPQTEGGWFDNGETYVFVLAEGDKQNDGRNYYVCDTLTLYAIWEPNGYTVRFDPNVPDGESYTGEKMEDQRFTYNQAQNLTANTYCRVGYRFGGWTYVDTDKSEKTLTDGQEVMNLTSVKGGIVVLKAIWTECTDHNITYTVTHESEQKAIMTKTCSWCQRTGTVTLTASDAVYDKTAHPASVVCSNPEWFSIESINYVGTKIGSEESVADPGQTVNAGDYTAKITVDGTAASVTYQIAKAAQPAPEEKPTYTEPEKNSSIVMVHPILYNVSSKTGLEAEYSARYYLNGELQETVWHKATKQENGNYQDVSIDLTQSLTYYFIYVRYAGDDNYLPSDEVMADGTFLFEGHIKLKFVVDEGITYLPVQQEGALKIDITLNDQYYLVGGKVTVTIEGDDKKLLKEPEPDENGDFEITRTSNSEISEDVTITVKIGSTKKLPSITSAVDEKQVFDPVSGNSAQISRDSAYTVLYTVKNYDTEVYGQPVLTFASNLPEKTTLILQSRDGGEISYWSYTVPSETQEIPLGSFMRMGGTDVFEAQSGDLSLQFVVDYSQTESGCSADSLQTKLTIQRKVEDSAAPDLSGGTPVIVTLSDTEFTLSDGSGEGLTYTLNYGFTPDIAASKWDSRELALVVSGENLPSDAVISARVNGVWRTCRPHITGEYIIPLGAALSGQVELILQSDMFPLQGATYQMRCQLYASQSVADNAPLNGSVIAAEESCAFTTSSKQFAVQVTEAQDKHLFSSNGSITVAVNQSLASGYTVKVQLQHKDESTGEYVNTGRKADSANGQYTFSLNGCADGSYRIVAIVERDDGFAITEAPYYFIIQ